MGYLLRMSGEIHDWLADLRASDPPAARLVGEALTALLTEGAGLGPPLVISPGDNSRPADFLAAIDQSYQSRLERLQSVRRGVSDVATLAKHIQLQIAELESLQAKLGDQRARALEAGRQDLAGDAADKLAAVKDQVAGLRQLLPGVAEADRKLTENSQRQQARVDAFRTRKETLKAAYTAARAERAVDDALAAPSQDAGDRGTQDEDPGAPATAAADRLREITRDIERELRSEPWTANPGDLRPPPGLMELRPGAPGGSEVRILFAVEPPGIALLIAVLEDRDAVRERYSEAVLLSLDLVQRVRAGQAPGAVARAFDDALSFLGEFFPGDVSEIEAGAAALVVRNRGRTLAEQRVRRGLTQAQVAERMSVRQERVSAIERAETGATEVRTLAGYIEALGGRLEIIADFGGERVVLR
jgi:phage shock protein A